MNDLAGPGEASVRADCCQLALIKVKDGLEDNVAGKACVPTNVFDIVDLDQLRK